MRNGLVFSRRMRAIRADKGAQLRLLDLQTVDTTLAQLDHRRQTLPQHAAIAKLRTERAAVASDLWRPRPESPILSWSRPRQRPTLSRSESGSAGTRLGSRTAPSPIPKALSSMLEEVSHLKKRISDLEDAELEVMEQLEAAVASQEKLLARAAQIDADLGEAIAERDRQLAALDGEMGGLREQRAEIVPLIPDDLLTLYDKIGASHGGVGAAELRARRCTGCQLEINAAELRAFSAAAEDEVLRCEECGRILIRTAQSGL